MGGTVLWRSCVIALAVLLLAIYSALILGFEVGVAVGLHVVKNVWLDLAGAMVILVVPTLLYGATLAIGEVDLDMGFFAGFAIAICGVVVTAQTYQGLDDRVLHERGRQVQAVVSHQYSQDNGADPPTRMTEFTDLSGQPIPGELSGVGGLKVGQRVTVTVDPAGKVPMVLGTPTGAGACHIVKITGGVEGLLLVWPAYRGAARLLRTKKARKPEEPPGRQEPVEPQGGLLG